MMEKKISFIHTNKFYMIAGLFLLFYLWISSKIPYTWDDWYWGIDEGIEYLVTGSLNARYVGNFFAVVLTRSHIVKTLVMGAVSWLIPIFMTKIVCKDAKNIPIYLLCNLFPAFMLPITFSQTYGWVAGYVNYVISALLLLVYIYIFNYNFVRQEETKTNLFTKMGLFFFGVSIQLFIENLTIFVLMVSILAFLYALYKKHNICFSLMMLLGNTLGFIIMFSSSMYSVLFGTGSSLGGVRNLAFTSNDGLGSIVFGLLDNMISDIFATMLLLNIIFYVLLLIQILCLARKHRKTVARKWNFLFTGLFIGLLYFVINLNFGFFFIVLSLILLIGICLYIKDTSLKSRCIMLFLCHVGVIAPLVAVDFSTTSIARLFITSSVFLMLMVASLFYEELTLCGSKKRFFYHATLVICTIVFVISSASVYNQIKLDSDKCLFDIEEAKTKGTALDLQPSEHLKKYVWTPYKVTKNNELWFRAFYDIPDSIEVLYEEE